MSRLAQARRELIAAALSYQAAELGDETGPHYDAQLELCDEVLGNAVDLYHAELISAKVGYGGN